MLTNYIHAALNCAKWEILADGSFYASIPQLPGVYAADVKLDACIQELQEVLEEWVMLGLRFKSDFPELEGCCMIIEEGDA